MKILHVYKDYYPVWGGIEGNIQQIAQRQVALGHQVTVLVTNPDKQLAEESIDGVKIIRAHRLATIASTPLSLSYPLQLAKLRPDIAHLHFPYPLGEISQWLFGRSHPYVITYHSDIVKQKLILQFYGPLLKRVLRDCNRVMPTSSNYIQSSEWLRPIADRCTAVPLGIDPTLFLSAERFPKIDQRPTIFFIGRHRYYKGLDTLLQAMCHVDANLVIGGDGPMRSEWQALALELGIGEKVRFIGSVSAEDLPRWYHSADLFVLPANSRAEAFGIVLMEAMAAGLPCITTELGTGTSFIVQHGKTGLIVPPQEPNALAQAINQLVQNPALRQQMGQAGRERILTEFTIERMVDRIEQVYSQVIGS